MRARPDIKPTITVLCTRVSKPGKNDWGKLVRLMKYLNNTINDKLILNAKNGVRAIEWYVDVAFAVHPDYRSHTGGVMMFKGGTGAVLSQSSKQKINTDSSTTAELVGVHDVLPMILWTPLFLEQQGYLIKENTVYQDNMSAILLEKNGKRSAGRRTRALNVKYFMITDQVENDKVKIEYCPTDRMIGDFMSKGLQGVKYSTFRSEIMGKTSIM